MAEGAGGGAGEELFVLRVADEALADKLHRVLREEATVHGHVELTFQGACGRVGALRWGLACGTCHPPLAWCPTQTSALHGALGLQRAAGLAQAAVT